MSNKISLIEFTKFLAPEGQQQFLDFVRQAKEERGAGWLKELRAEFPMMDWIAGLVINKTQQEAFDELKAAYPGIPLGLFKDAIFQLHEDLSNEIN